VAGVVDLDRAQWRGVVSGTKTRRARRLPLTEDAADVLRWHRQAMIAAQHPGVGTGLVFPAPRAGRPRATKAGVTKIREHMSQRTAAQAMKRLCKAAGVPVLTPKGMRRTFNDLLRRQGVDRLVLRSMTGHSSEEMTRTYSAIRADDRAQAVRGLAGKIAPKKEGE
jgi:integrase